MHKKLVRNKRWRPYLVGSVAVVLGFAVLGVIWIFQSSAATMAASREAEDGTVAGNAAAVDGSGASNGKSVKFGNSGGGSLVVAAAGDIAMGRGEEEETAALITGDPSVQLVLALGDLAYESGTSSEFNSKYHPSWGQFKDKTKPTPGNHEYYTGGASGYFDYFNDIAEYYSFDMGGWHFISLNSNIARTATSTQVNWLKNDLAQHPAQCTLAFWHHPRFSSGDHGDDSSVQPFFQALYDANADLILTGHSHIYEKYSPSKPDGTVDNTRGIRNFVVGTGGASLDGNGDTDGPLELRNNSKYGVIKLTLQATGYSWKFVDIGGATVDEGTGTCH
jgi:hypothetical protein